MSKNDFSLEHMSDAAFFVSENRAAEISPAARRFLPDLIPGEPLPGYLDVVRPDGEFSRRELTYVYHRIDSSEGSLVLFWPKAQTVLSQRQLEGVVREMRELLSRMMFSEKHPGGAFRRDFCQMLRLVEHLDFLCQTGREDGVEFHPVTMDLAGLCRRLLQEAAPLLRAAEVEARLDASCSSLLIPGDPALLTQMFYGLLSNGAKELRRSGGTLSVGLRGWKSWALLTVSNGDSLDAQERLLSLDPGRDVDRPPLPGEGAGLGFSILHHIARLHRGALLAERRGDQFAVCVRLPTGPLDSRLSVHSPRVERGGGLPLSIVELSDVLPPSVYDLEDFLE